MDNKYIKIIGLMICIPILLIVLKIVLDVKEYNKAVEYGERTQAYIINKYSEEGETRQEQRIVPTGNGQIISMPVTTKMRIHI